MALFRGRSSRHRKAATRCPRTSIWSRPRGDPARAAEHTPRKIGGDVANPPVRPKGAQGESAAAGNVENRRAIRHVLDDRRGPVQKPRVRAEDQQAEDARQGLALSGEVVERRPGPVIPAASPNPTRLGNALSTIIALQGASATSQKTDALPVRDPRGPGSQGSLAFWRVGRRGGRSPTSLIGCRGPQLKSTAEKPRQHTGGFLYSVGITPPRAVPEARVCPATLGSSAAWTAFVSLRRRTGSAPRDRRCACSASRPRSRAGCGSPRRGSAIPGSGNNDPRRRPGP